MFRWGVEAWKDEFEVNPLRADWATSAGGDVVTRNGMLTLMAYPSSGTVTATPTSHKAKVGRWEARVRVWEKDRTVGTPYRAFWELVPNKKYRCGAKSIVIASYSQDEAQVTGAVRTLPEQRVLVLPGAAADAGLVPHVRDRGDRRPHLVVRRQAWSCTPSGVPRRCPTCLQAAVPDAGRRRRLDAPTWMQMDWVRYYTLDRPNALPIDRS